MGGKNDPWLLLAKKRVMIMNLCTVVSFGRKSKNIFYYSTFFSVEGCYLNLSADIVE
jgi:hypothetical protein